MVGGIVNKNLRIFNHNTQRGDSMLEVILAMAVVAMVAPFLYTQVSTTTNTIRDMATVKRIINLRGPVLNFVRMNQSTWPDNAQIKLSESELTQISDLPIAGFIDKYTVSGASVTDVYLAFNTGYDTLRTNKIARNIGGDAAVVGDDGVAYGASFAVAAPDFQVGDLIYRISRDVSGEDRTKYLHRGTSGDDELNVMRRELNMGANNVYDVGTLFAKSVDARSATATFIESEHLQSDSIYFSSGANINNAKMTIDSLRVTGDVSGFRNIYADKINGTSFGTVGTVIADRAEVLSSVNVARNFVLKSDAARTVSGFTIISTNSLATPFIATEQIVFLEDFGLTISGELMMSTTSPLRIGSWVFPSTTPPSFASLTLARGVIPPAVSKSEFNVIMSSGWKNAGQLVGTIK